jgi:M-phase inducer tyrosine phosphatase
LPPFRFGNVATSDFASSSTPSLIESPIGENDTFGSMLPPLRRTSAAPIGRSSGSPCAGHVRKASNDRRPTLSRPPRKQIRRSLSMFQHPDDVMKEEQEIFELAPAAKLTSMMEVEQEHTLQLPHFVPDNDADGLPRITQETMTDILDTKYNSSFKQIIIVDCRFEYEYNGGHIESAVNFNDKQLLAEKLFENGTDPSNTLLVLHCEYSVHRAPLTAKFIRSHDRNINMEHYPRLTFPEMYILDGGYSRFYSEQPSKCYPQNYVEMNDERHEQACERGMAKVKSRPKLFRAQTFAFGQNGSDDMEDSPTAQGKGASVRGGLSGRSHTYQVSPNVAENIGSSFARRMASY